MNLSIKELEKKDAQKIIDYWHGLSDDKLRGLGAGFEERKQKYNQWRKTVG